MPKKSLQIKNFSGGLNTFSDPRDIKDNEFQSLDNVSTDENARLRLSGGFKEMEIDYGGNAYENRISLPLPSSQVSAIDSDYKPIVVDNGDFSKDSEGDDPSGWETVTGDGGGWKLGEVQNTKSSIYVTYPCGNKKASVAADSVADLGSITSPGFKLKPGETYLFDFSIGSTHPFFYHPEAELPRVILQNVDLSKYLETESFKDIDDWSTSFPNWIPKATSNLITAPSFEDGNLIQWSGYANWNATGDAHIDREAAVDDSIASYVGTPSANNYVLKCNFTAGYSAGDYIITTDGIDVSAFNKGYDGSMYIDCIYQSFGNGSPKLKVFNASDDTNYGEVTLSESANTYTNIKMGTTGWEYGGVESNTLKGASGITIPTNLADNIKIGIAKTTGGSGTFKITAIRLYSANSQQLGYSSTKWPKAHSFPFGHTLSWQANVSYPNTWNQTTKSPYVMSSWSPGKVEVLARPRKYSISVTIPYEYEESDNWQMKFCAGKWGGSGALTNLGVYVSYITIQRIQFNTSQNVDTQFLLVPQYDDSANTTSIKAYTWESDIKKYESMPAIYADLLPTFQGRAYVNFTNVFGRTFISNGSFDNQDPVYTFFYDTISGQESFRVAQDTFFIPNFQTLETIAGANIINSTYGDLRQIYGDREEENNDMMYFDEGVTVTSINTRSGINTEWQPTTVNRYKHPNPSGDEIGGSEWGSGAGGENSADDPIHKVFEFSAADMEGFLENTVAKIQVGVNHWSSVRCYTCLRMRHHQSSYWEQTDDEFPGGRDSSAAIPIGFQYEILKIGNEPGSGQALDVQQVYVSDRIDMTYNPDAANSYQSSGQGQPGGNVDYESAEQDEIETSQYSGGDITSGTQYITLTFPLGEIDEGDNLAIRIIPNQYQYPAGSRAYKFTSEYNGMAGGDLGDHGIYSMRGTGYDKWDVSRMRIWSYDSLYTGGTNVLNLDEDSVGINLEFGTIAGANSWNETWTVTLTSVNFFDEESNLSEEEHIMTNGDSAHAPLMVVQIPASNTFLEKMIKEIKVYFTKGGWEGIFKLQATVDLLENKIFLPGGLGFDGGTFTGTDGQEVIAFTIPRANFLTPNASNSYEAETLISQENARESGQLLARWRTAVVANNRLFVGNIMKEGKIYSDRMLKSSINRYGIFPVENFIDVALNDGDEIISLQYYKDKILQFKRKKLFVINVATDDDEFLEETIDGVGINDEVQIVKTLHGIAWVNERGLFIYDGKAVNNLVEDKLAVSQWKDTISGWDVKGEFLPILGYDKVSDKLMILPTGYSLQEIIDINNNDSLNTIDDDTSDSQHRDSWRTNISYVYDFKRKSFTFNYSGNRALDVAAPHYYLPGTVDRLKLPPINGKRSNFFYDKDGKLMIISDDEYSGGLYVYNDVPSGTPGLQEFYNDRNMRIITKDYDFGDPSIRKKIYKVYVTFKSTDEETILVENASLTKDFYSSSFVKVYYAVDGSNNWKEFDSIKSKNYDTTRGLIDDKSEQTTTLTTALDETTTTVVVGSTSNILQNYVIKIGEALFKDEHMLVKQVVNSTNLIVERGYGYTSDDVNTYKSLTGEAHIAAETVKISNGDWIQAELVPGESLSNIKSLKLMFVQSLISADDTGEAELPSGEELIDWFENPGTLSGSVNTGELTLLTSNSFKWEGSGESFAQRYDTIFDRNLIEIGKKYRFTMSVTDATILDGSESGNSNMNIYFLHTGFDDGNFNSGVSTIWSTGEHDSGELGYNWTTSPGAQPDNTVTQDYDIVYEFAKDAAIQYPKIFLGNRVDEATVTFSVQEILPNRLIGNVPKGFQINDMSIIYRTKNVK